MRFVFEYFRWHYSDALVAILRTTRNFVWFFYEFYSIPLLLKTFFMPFHRMKEVYTRHVNLGKWLEAFTVNTIMRVVGAVLRLILIFLGIVCMVFAGVCGIAFLVAWILSPLLLLFLISYGVKLVSIP